MYNFDEIIPRHNTDSFKWDFFNDPQEVIPMPVADMDFRCPPAVLDALKSVADHGIMGYSFVPKELKDIFTDRMKNLYNWKIENEWQVWIPGLVPGLTATCKSVGNFGDAVLSTIPVYGPFHLAPSWAGKNLQTVLLKEENNRYTFDFEAIKKAITPETKVFLLCNPYNPAGTVFTKEELSELANICNERKVVICADEIHCDLILNNSKKHIPIASLDEQTAMNTITLQAPSKTFNIAGLGCSVAIIPNEELRQNFIKAKSGMFPELNRFGIRSAIAAYRDSEDWRLELISYLKANHDFLYERINNIKGLKMNALEATYLAWIDAKDLGIENIQKKLLEAGVRVNAGEMFLGEGFFRLNFGCPKSILEESIRRIENVLK